MWDLMAPVVQSGLRQGRRELNEMRARLGLGPVQRLHGGLSQRLCMVGTFAQLEYRSEWPHNVHVVGPVMWEPPFGEVQAPPGDAPLVLVAPSTAQDPEHRLLRAALAGLADEPVRVLATWNRRPVYEPLRGAGQRPAGRVGLLLAHDAAVLAGDLPCGPRDDGPRACVRESGGLRAALRATWPRTRRGPTGPGSACGCHGGC